MVIIIGSVCGNNYKSTFANKTYCEKKERCSVIIIQLRFLYLYHTMLAYILCWKSQKPRIRAQKTIKYLLFLA